jgi:hypothetical protein
VTCSRAAIVLVHCPAPCKDLINLIRSYHDKYWSARTLRARVGVMTWGARGHANRELASGCRDLMIKLPCKSCAFHLLLLLPSSTALEASDCEPPRPPAPYCCLHRGVWCACCALAKLQTATWHGSRSFEAEWSFSVAAVEIQHFTLYQTVRLETNLKT